MSSVSEVGHLLGLITHTTVTKVMLVLFILLFQYLHFTVSQPAVPPSIKMVVPVGPVSDYKRSAAEAILLATIGFILHFD